MPARRVKCPHCGFEFEYPVDELAEATTTDAHRMWPSPEEAEDVRYSPDVVELVCANHRCRKWFKWSIREGRAVD